jgi:hypothetical protein
MLTIGILTYNSPTTLHSTLLSYKASGILDFTDDIIVVIQPSEKNMEEKQICETFSINKIIMNETNTKMAGAIDLIHNEAKYDYVLFLECDFRAVTKKDQMYNLLNYGIELLNKGGDIVRLRSLKNPGHPIEHNCFKRYFANPAEISNNPIRVLKQMYYVTHFMENPEIVFPDYITKVNNENEPRTYLMSSKNAVYTNNPHIVSKQFYKEFIKPYVVYGGHLEDSIDHAWHNDHEHKIYITEGCFTHMRIDGHNGCRCCPIDCGGVSNICNCHCCDNQIIKQPKIFEESDLA